MTFYPLIDVPLTLLVLCGFIANYCSWANRESDSTVDLKSRLPRALFRIGTFFVSLAFFCWWANMGVWLLFAIIIVVGLIGSIIAGQNSPAEITLLAVPLMLREWCFGFPHLVLQPPSDSHEEPEPSRFVGANGTVASPLKPSGLVIVNSQELQAVSKSGEMIDAGAQITVVEFRNRRAYVKLAAGGSCINDTTSD